MDPKRVYVSGYPSYTQPQDLTHIFSRYGTVKVEKMMNKHTILVFADEDIAQEVIKNSEKIDIYGEFLTIRPYNGKQEPNSHKREFPMSKQREIVLPPQRLDLSGDFHRQLDELLAAVRLSQQEVCALARLYSDLQDALQALWPDFSTQSKTQIMRDTMSSSVFTSRSSFFGFLELLTVSRTLSIYPPLVYDVYPNHKPEEGRRENDVSTVRMHDSAPICVIESAVSGPTENAKNTEPVTSERMIHANIAPAHTILPNEPCYNDCRSQARKSYTQVLEQGEWKHQDENKQWILVQKKKLKNKFIGNKGKAIVESNVNFKAADIRIPLYIYNIAKDVTKNDIQNYITNKTQMLVDLEKIIMKTPKDYDAYKVYVPKSKLTYFMQDEFWPEGVAFRRFIDFKGRHRSGQMPKSTLNQQQ